MADSINNKIAIIGAGISGITSGKLLKDKGYSVELFEKAPSAGGLVRCTIEEGNLFHRVGGHVFNTKIPKVAEWFWSHFNRDQDFIFSKRNAKILFQNSIIGYPIENYIYNLNEATLTKIIDELLSINKEQEVESNNFDEFLRNNFGETLYQLYFKPYNEKIWKVDLNNVPLEWLDGKLPMPNFREIILKNIQRKEESDMVHSTFNYPAKNGSSFIADTLSKSLNIHFNCNIESIQLKNGNIKINEKLFDQLIFTGDVRVLGYLIELDDPEFKDLSKKVKTLKSNGTSNVLCYTDEVDYSWMYLPSEEVMPHRIIYTGNFSDQNNTGNQLTCTVEFSGLVDEETINQEIKKLPGNLEPIAYNQEPNSYIIQDKDTRQNISDLKTVLKKYNIHLVGRFAEWEYYNMDKAIEAAMSLVENNFN
jgi:protoporphyrinogen oxidase